MFVRSFVCGLSGDKVNIYLENGVEVAKSEIPEFEGTAEALNNLSIFK